MSWPHAARALLAGRLLLSSTATAAAAAAGPANQAAAGGLICALAAGVGHQQLRWASKKQGGSTNNRGNQLPKMLGVKLFGGQAAQPGSIIVRQRGTRIHAGPGVGTGRDHTLFALVPGKIEFSWDGRAKRRSVSVVPA